MFNDPIIAPSETPLCPSCILCALCVTKNMGTQRTQRTTKDTTQMLNKEPNDERSVATKLIAVMSLTS